MKNKASPKQAILEAVVTCIEKYGIDKVTTRKIAQEAGANLAAINYYFRSKNELLQQALSMTIQHMTEDIFSTIDNSELGFEQTLERVFFYLIDGGLHFPGTSAAHLYEAVLEKRYDSPSARAMHQIFEGLSRQAAKEYPERDPGEMRLLISEILASILFNLLAPNFFQVGRKYQLTNSSHAKTLAEHYTRLFLEARQ